MEANLNHDVFLKPIDPALIKKDPRGNRYVKAMTAVEIADEAFMHQWSMDVGELTKVEVLDFDIIYHIRVSVEVPGLGRRSALGGVSLREWVIKSKGVDQKPTASKKLSELLPSDFQMAKLSDIQKVAVTDGLKKALSYFRICAEVYEDPDKMEAEQRVEVVENPVRLTDQKNKDAFKAFLTQEGINRIPDLIKKLGEHEFTVVNDDNVEQVIKALRALPV